MPVVVFCFLMMGLGVAFHSPLLVLFAFLSLFFAIACA